MRQDTPRYKMEDIVLCYDTLSPDAIKFARKIYESTMMILEVNVTSPISRAHVKSPIICDQS